MMMTYTILYSTMLRYTRLYYTVPYCTMLHYTNNNIVYYAIL